VLEVVGALGVLCDVEVEVGIVVVLLVEVVVVGVVGW